MRILFLTNLLPYPLDNGGKIKTFTTLKSLFSAGHCIDLVCFKENNFSMLDEEEELLKICNSVKQIYLPLTTVNHKKYMIKLAIKSLFSILPFSIYKYCSNEMKDLLKEYKNNFYDIIYFDHLPMCVYLNLAKENWNNSKYILDEHNCESTIVQRKAQEKVNLFKKVFFKYEIIKLKRFEVKSIIKVDKTMVLSTVDYQCLKQLTHKDFKHSIIPISVPDKGMKKNEDTFKLNILFIGTLTWEPNNSGLIWFLKEVLPLLDSKKLNYHLYIVGKSPSVEVKKICEYYPERVTITGYVSSVEEYYNKCQCMIVPLFIGSGQRVKLIEAFSKGMPAISTTIGAEGLEYKKQESILIADDKNTFAEALISMTNDNLRNKLQNNCREIYEKYYSPEVISNRISKEIEIERKN